GRGDLGLRRPGVRTGAPGLHPGESVSSTGPGHRVPGAVLSEISDEVSIARSGRSRRTKDSSRSGFTTSRPLDGAETVYAEAGYDDQGSLAGNTKPPAQFLSCGGRREALAGHC